MHSPLWHSLLRVEVLCGNKWSYAFFGVWLRLGLHTFLIFGRIVMPNYEKLYLTLFNALTDAIESIDKANYGTARAILIDAQQKAEDIYIDSDEDPE